MAYIGFDLDETLGSFGPLHNHILFLTPDAVYKNLLIGQEPFVLSESLRKKLRQALNTFAACLLGKDSELGILRKGILKIMRRLAEAKANGHVKALSIYSNNGNLGLLFLASAMIEQGVGAPGLFCNHIDWFNPIRIREITPGRPGMAEKTPGVLRRSFVQANCGIDDIEAIPIDKMYFFDDKMHYLINTIITYKNYFQVTPYKREVLNLEPVNECFEAALQSSGLAEDLDYLAYIKPLLASLETPTNKYEDILATIKKHNKTYAPRREPFHDDTVALLRRIDSIFPPTNYSENYFPVVDGGRWKKMKRRLLRVMKTIRNRRNAHKSTRKN